MTYILDDREFYDKKHAEMLAHEMADKDASLVFTANDTITKVEVDDYIENRATYYEKQIKIKKE